MESEMNLTTTDSTDTHSNFRKGPKFWDTDCFYCKHSKIQTKRFYHGVMHLNDANGITNSEDTDKTAPRGAV